jgi:hypothetical protein
VVLLWSSEGIAVPDRVAIGLITRRSMPDELLDDVTRGLG